MIHKIIIFTLVAWFGCSILNGQTTEVKEDLDLLPISGIKKYEDLIKPKELKPNYVTGSYNNDSLYQAYNNDRSYEVNLIGGFGEKFEGDYWFKENAHRFELDTGTVWLFKASTITGISLSIELDSLTLPKSSQLAYFEYEGDDSGYLYRTHGCLGEDFSWRKIFWGNSKDIYIEYFEPRGFNTSFDFRITSVGYTFAQKKGKSYRFHHIKVWGIWYSSI